MSGQSYDLGKRILNECVREVLTVLEQGIGIDRIPAFIQLTQMRTDSLARFPNLAHIVRAARSIKNDFRGAVGNYPPFTEQMMETIQSLLSATMPVKPIYSELNQQDIQERLGGALGRLQMIKTLRQGGRGFRYTDELVSTCIAETLCVSIAKYPEVSFRLQTKDLWVVKDAGGQCCWRTDYRHSLVDFIYHF